MRERWTNVYIGLVCALAFGALLEARTWPEPSFQWSWWGVIVLLAAAVLAENSAVPLPRGGAVSVATMVHVVAALLLPPWVAGLVAGAGMLVTQVRERADPRRLLFNTSATTAQVVLTALLAHGLGLAGDGMREGGWGEVAAFFGVAAFSYLVNDLLVTGVVSIASGQDFRTVLAGNSRYSAPAEIAVAVIGGLVALIWVVAPYWLPVALFPAFISQLTFKYIHASARRAAELEHRALHDRLTGLPNRAMLQRRLRQAIDDRAGPSRPVALLLMDLDAFKDVNDTFGHQYGDVLLQEMGPRLQQVLREGDLIARLGGDEFAVMLPGTGVNEALALAQRLRRVLEEPFLIDGHRVEVGASLGVSISPDHGDEPETLLRRADIAMYVAKGSGAGCAVYTPSQDQHSPARLALSADLREAFDGDQLYLEHQPKVSFKNGALVGVEALARWQHPERGYVPPEEFIHLAERTGLIKPFVSWLIDASLRQHVAWREAGFTIPVAVNLSMHNVHDPLLPEIVASLLNRWKVDPSILRVEVTESVLMADPARAGGVLGKLKGMGVRVSVDDFGTGYSSLAYLKRLPVDELKIDHSFVRQVAIHGDDQAIVRSIIRLAHDLGLSVVAEGLEDGAAWDVLAAAGCDVAQGFHVGRPMAADDLLRWRRTWSLPGGSESGVHLRDVRAQDLEPAS